MRRKTSPPTRSQSPERDPTQWVRSLVKRALAIRLYPTGPVNWEAVEAAILAVDPIDGKAKVRLHVDTDRNALVAERVLFAAGLEVCRDAHYDPFRPGHRGFRLIAEPAPDGFGTWERDL